MQMFYNNIIIGARVYYICYNFTFDELYTMPKSGVFRTWCSKLAYKHKHTIIQRVTTAEGILYCCYCLHILMSNCIVMRISQNINVMYI